MDRCSGGYAICLFFRRLRQFDLAVRFLEGFDLAAGQVEDLAVDGAALVSRQIFQLVVQLLVDMDGHTCPRLREKPADRADVGIGPYGRFVPADRERGAQCAPLQETAGGSPALQAGRTITLLFVYSGANAKSR